MLHYQILAYTIHEKIKKSHTNKINSKYQPQCEIPDGSYSVSDIQDYFDIKNMKQSLIILQ